VERAVRELVNWEARGGPATRDDVVRVLEQTAFRARADEPGCVRVIDLLEARTRRFGYVFLLGLEEGTLPRRSVEPPFLTDEARRELEARAPGRRLRRADQLARDRYLFYTACTRPWKRLTLVRQASTDEGRPLEASPFWEEARSLFSVEDVQRATRRRPLSALAWALEDAPSERGGCAPRVVAVDDQADAGPGRGSG
jgi:inactivated superfamily I helicase